MPKNAPVTNNWDKFRVDFIHGAIQFVTQASPASKLILFYSLAAIFCFLFKISLLFIIITAAYALIIPVLLVFMPERVWSEPMLLEWYKLGLGSKGNNNILTEDAEIVQPVTQQKQISAKANISKQDREHKTTK